VARADSGGWAARFGMLVIHKDAVPEAELWAMAPRGVTLHVARFESPRQRGHDFADDAARAVAESPDVARGLGFFGQLDLDVACLCFGSGSFLGGPGFDEAFVAAASVMAGGVRVTTAAMAMLDALRATGVTRPLLVRPPWFTETSSVATERFFRDAGVDLAGTHRFDLGGGWRGMRSYEVYDNGGQWYVRPEEVYRQVRRTFPAGADGVLIPGSGFRSLEAIELLERDLGVPVVTSNQACLWHCLRLAGLRPQVTAAGRLFDLPLPCVGSTVPTVTTAE
jgi:maleate isomerase